MTTRIGRILADYIKDEEIFLVGSLSIGVAIGEKKAVVIGSGNIGILTGLECYVIAMRKPIVIGIARCGTILALGGRHGVAIDSLKADKAFLKKTYVTKLQVSEAVISDLCVIDELEHADLLVFTDPHTYLKSIGEVKEEKYSYKLAE